MSIDVLKFKDGFSKEKDQMVERDEGSDTNDGIYNSLYLGNLDEYPTWYRKKENPLLPKDGLQLRIDDKIFDLLFVGNNDIEFYDFVLRLYLLNHGEKKMPNKNDWWRNVYVPPVLTYPFVVKDDSILMKILMYGAKHFVKPSEERCVGGRNPFEKRDLLIKCDEKNDPFYLKK